MIAKLDNPGAEDYGSRLFHVSLASDTALVLRGDRMDTDHGVLTVFVNGFDGPLTVLAPGVWTDAYEVSSPEGLPVNLTHRWQSVSEA